MVTEEVEDMDAVVGMGTGNPSACAEDMVVVAVGTGNGDPLACVENMDEVVGSGTPTVVADAIRKRDRGAAVVEHHVFVVVSWPFSAPYVLPVDVQ
jgi:hypothetical protein